MLRSSSKQLRLSSARRGLIGHPRPAVEQLIAAAPHHEAGMLLEAVDDRAGFLIEDGVSVVIGIGIAGEGELLPDHEAQFIAEVVEILFLHGVAAPHTQDVHVCAGPDRDAAIGRAIENARENVGADEIGALGEDIAAIDAEDDGRGATALGEPSGKAQCPRAL